MTFRKAKFSDATKDRQSLSCRHLFRQGVLGHVIRFYCRLF